MKTNLLKQKISQFHSVILTILRAFFIFIVLVGIGGTSANAAYRNPETVPTNSIGATTLDLNLTHEEFAETFVIGVEKTIEKSVTLNQHTASLDIQYTGATSGSSAACSAYELTVAYENTNIYIGSVSDFQLATTTNFGDFTFTITLPDTASLQPGDECQSEFVFTAWKQGTLYTDSLGFYDIETIPVYLITNTVVLNEVLADPDELVPAPANTEFIELYNNGETDIDLENWQISVTTDSVEKRYTISTSVDSDTVTPYSGNTVLSAQDWVILQFSSIDELAVTGATIALYDDNNTLLDSYTYTSAKFGASDARIPDGLGDWIDPTPTPGEPNELVIEIIDTLEEVLQVTSESDTISTTTTHVEETATTSTITTSSDQTKEQTPDVEIPIIDTPTEETESTDTTTEVENSEEEVIDAQVETKNSTREEEHTSEPEKTESEDSDSNETSNSNSDLSSESSSTDNGSNDSSGNESSE